MQCKGGKRSARQPGSFADAKVTAAQGGHGHIFRRRKKSAAGPDLMMFVQIHLGDGQFQRDTDHRHAPGQTADIKVDAIGSLFHGHLDSIQTGSAQPSACCPENATGNM